MVSRTICRECDPEGVVQARMQRAAIGLLVMSLVGCGSEAPGPTATPADSSAPTPPPDSGAPVDSSAPPIDSSALAETGTTPPTDAPLESAPAHDDKFASACAHAICDGFDACCTAAGKTEDHDACVATVGAFFASRIDEAEARGAVVDWAKMPACLDAMRASALACADASLDGYVAIWKFNAACSGAVQGPVAPGGTCRSGFDCQQIPGAQTQCDAAPGGAVCQRQFAVGLGERCDGFASGAPELHTCDPKLELVCESASHTCVARPKAGEKCLTSYIPGCDAADRCLKDGTCGPRLGVGAACTRAEDCAPGTGCDATKHCLALAKLGEPCATSDECASAACVGGRCSSHSPSTSFGAMTSCK